MHPVKILIPLLIFSLVAAWLSSSGPSPFEVAITHQAQEHLARQYADLGDVTAVEKVSGRQDGDRYLAEFRYDLIFTKDFSAVVAARRQRAALSAQMFARARVDKELEALRTSYGEFRTGASATETARLTFVQTAQGWRLP